jgi:hemerythrin-like domain-containing protein
MLRNKNLVALSRQHHHALALCVRLDRALEAGPVDCLAWQAEMVQQFAQEVGVHFAAEESEVFPVAARFAGLSPVVADLLAEHAVLRALFARAAAGTLDPAALAEFAEKFTQHIRKEERQLFEGMQEVLGENQLDAMGAQLEKALAAATDACILPTEATRLRPQNSG